MSEARKGTKPTRYDQYQIDSTDGSWLGWIAFAGLVMILSGTFQAIAGLVGLLRSTFYSVSQSQVLVIHDVHTWGWVNLIVGIIVALAGASLLTGSLWARILTVIVAMGAAITNMVSIPLYPIWSLICLAMCVLVIYAVITHGGELKEANRY
jgi:hypothetical protein